jgi:hypothetical protein
MDEKKKSYTIKDTRGSDTDTPQKKEEQTPKESLENSGAEKASEPHDEKSFPKIDFSSLIMSLASAALISLGKFPEPQTGGIIKDLELAQQNIDIISILEEKTRGNLSPQEKNLIENVLYELRIEFVKAAKEETK